MAVMMPVSTEILAQHWALAVFSFLAFGIAGIMMLGGWLFGGRSSPQSQNIPFESGIDSVGSARLRFRAGFYLVAMFFVIFDVEALYLYAWSASVREAGFVGLIEAAVFIFVLLAGLLYLVRSGGLDWTPVRSRGLLADKARKEQGK